MLNQPRIIYYNQIELRVFISKKFFAQTLIWCHLFRVRKSNIYSVFPDILSQFETG